MLEPPLDKLQAWDPRDEHAWTERLAADRALAPTIQTAEMRAATATVLERARAMRAQALALTGSTARRQRTQISDVDYHVVGRRPAAHDLPADIDVYAGTAASLTAKLRARDDFVQWTLRYGCILYDDGVLRRAAGEVLEDDIWPDGQAKLARLPELQRLGNRLIAVGDRDAAQDHVRASLTSAARGLLLTVRIFPLSRGELPAQLRCRGVEDLARALERTIYETPTLEELGENLRLLDLPAVTAAA